MADVAVLLQDGPYRSELVTVSRGCLPSRDTTTLATRFCDQMTAWTPQASGPTSCTCSTKRRRLELPVQLAGLQASAPLQALLMQAGCCYTCSIEGSHPSKAHPRLRKAPANATATYAACVADDGDALPSRVEAPLRQLSVPVAVNAHRLVLVPCNLSRPGSAPQVRQNRARGLDAVHPHSSLEEGCHLRADASAAQHRGWSLTNAAMPLSVMGPQNSRGVMDPEDLGRLQSLHPSPKPAGLELTSPGVASAVRQPQLQALSHGAAATAVLLETSPAPSKMRANPYCTAAPPSRPDTAHRYRPVQQAAAYVWPGQGLAGNLTYSSSTTLPTASQSIPARRPASPTSAMPEPNPVQWLASVPSAPYASWTPDAPAATAAAGAAVTTGSNGRGVAAARTVSSGWMPPRSSVGPWGSMPCTPVSGGFVGSAPVAQAPELLRAESVQRCAATVTTGCGVSARGAPNARGLQAAGVSDCGQDVHGRCWGSDAPADLQQRNQQQRLVRGREPQEQERRPEQRQEQRPQQGQPAAASAAVRTQEHEAVAGTELVRQVLLRLWPLAQKAEATAAVAAAARSEAKALQTASVASDRPRISTRPLEVTVGLAPELEAKASSPPPARLRASLQTSPQVPQSAPQGACKVEGTGTPAMPHMQAVPQEGTGLAGLTAVAEEASHTADEAKLLVNTSEPCSPARAAPEPALHALERLLEAAAAAAAAAAALGASAAISPGRGSDAESTGATVPLATPGQDKELLGAPQRPASPVATVQDVPRVDPAAFFEPDGSLLQGLVLQTACNIIRLVKARSGAPGGLSISLPWCERAAHASSSSGTKRIGSGAGAGAGPIWATAVDRQGAVPLAAALQLLASFAGAARALQLLEASEDGFAQALAVEGTGMTRVHAACGTYKALAPLMRQGLKYAERLMVRVERALTGDSGPEEASPSGSPLRVAE